MWWMILDLKVIRRFWYHCPMFFVRRKKYMQSNPFKIEHLYYRLNDVKKRGKFWKGKNHNENMDYSEKKCSGYRWIWE